MVEVKWVKLYLTMFDNKKIKYIRTLPDGNDIILIWIMLLLSAGKCNSNGYIFLTENIPYSPEMLADDFNMPLNTVKFALKILQDLHMINADDQGILISNWEEYQSADKLEQLKEYNRLAKQRQRERNKQKLLSECQGQSQEQVNGCQDTDIDIDIDKDIDKENIYVCDTPDEIPNKGKSQNKKTGKGNYTDDFEEFWKLYPRKIDKSRAFRAWNARLKEKNEPAVIIQATINYSNYCKVQRTEERFIKHPSTFVGPDKPFAEFINLKTHGQVNGPRSWNALQQLQDEYEEEENCEKNRDD